MTDGWNRCTGGHDPSFAQFTRPDSARPPPDTPYEPDQEVRISTWDKTLFESKVHVEYVFYTKRETGMSQPARRGNGMDMSKKQGTTADRRPRRRLIHTRTRSLRSQDQNQNHFTLQSSGMQGYPVMARKGRRARALPKQPYMHTPAAFRLPFESRCSFRHFLRHGS